MNANTKTPLEYANEMLVKDNPAERLKKIEAENPSIASLITTEVDLARGTGRKN